MVFEHTLADTAREADEMISEMLRRIPGEKTTETVMVVMTQWLAKMSSR